MQTFLQHILRRPVSVAMACIAVACGGVFALWRLPLGLAPIMDLPRLTIHTSWSGASAENVESMLTAPLEEIVSAVKGVRGVRSVSREGHSRVEVEFDPRTDMDLTRLQLNEQLSVFARRLRVGATHPVLHRYLPADIEKLQGFLSFSLTGAVSRATLARIARETVVPRLMAVRGVAQVRLEGGGGEDLRIELLPEKIHANNTSVGDVMAALEAYRPEQPLGAVSGPAGVAAASLSSYAWSLQAMKEIPVKQTESSHSVRLGDLGNVAVTPSATHELSRINGRECVTIVVNRDPLTSLTATARDVHSCAAELSRDLPSTISLSCETDRSREVVDELHRLSRDAIFSLFLLWGVLALFLGSGRAPAVLLLSILLSSAGTLLVLWTLTIPLHLFTLGGLALGMGRLLDDSIVVMENLRRRDGEKGDVHAIIEGTNEMVMAVTASTAATVGALVPILFLPRELQSYLLEFSAAVAASLCISLLVSFTVIPSAANRWTMKGTGILVHPRGRAATLYRRLLEVALRHRRLVLFVAVWMFGFPVWLLPARIESPSLPAWVYNETIGGTWFMAARQTINALFGGASYQFFKNVPRSELLDPGAETFLIMQASFQQGTDLAAADTVARVLEHQLLEAGAPRLTTRVLEGGFIIRIDFPDSVLPTLLPQSLRRQCMHLAAQTGGATVSVAGFGAGFSGGLEMQPAFTLCVRGYGYVRVREIAQALREKLLLNPRVASADIDRTVGQWSRMQEIVLNVDRDGIARYGLTPRQVSEAVRVRVETSTLPRQVHMQGMQLPVMVAMKGAQTVSVAELSESRVVREKGGSVPLGSVLRAQERPAPSEIVREDQQYVRWVSFEYKGPYRHAEAFLDATIDAFPLPEGYSIDRSSSSAVSGESGRALGMAALAALLVVFMVTSSLYESLLDPFIIMLSVPLAYIGVFLAFILAEVPFGRGGYLSVIFLTGIAVANAIVIVDFIARREKEKGSSIVTLVDASACRLRPVLMTTLTTAGSMIPMLLGEQNSVWYSLALGMLGGLVTSALLTLVVVPVLYAVTHKLSPGPSLTKDLKIKTSNIPWPRSWRS